MRFMYTRPDGGVSIITAAPKEDLERVLGALSDDEYVNHVLARSVPDDASKLRTVGEEDIPDDQEFRDAWVDETEATSIDISLAKAKEIALANLRTERNKKLDESDKLITRAVENGDDLAEIKAERQALRDATEPLKQLEAVGVNDEAVLTEIKKLSKLGNGA